MNTLYYGDDLKILRGYIAGDTNKGNVVPDPLCGCGTAIAAVHDL